MTFKNRCQHEKPSELDIQYEELIQLSREININSELFIQAKKLFMHSIKEANTIRYQEYQDSLGGGVMTGKQNCLTLDMTDRKQRLRKRMNGKQYEISRSLASEARKVNRNINTLGNTQPLYWSSAKIPEDNPMEYSWDIPTFFSYHIILNDKGGETK